MRRLTAKLRSRRGASITFALLLFLVCAIVSGVVVVAASTVGGRMSGMRETDQRYYAATSAARELQSIFESEEVPVTYTDTTATAESTNAILKAASEAVVNKWLNVDPPLDLTIEPVTLGSADDAGAVQTEYICRITPSLDNGLMRFDILAQGPLEKKGNGAYKLSILFTPNLKASEPDELEDGTVTGTATVSWKLNSLSKGRATVSGG